jgi:hypothetical protein
MQYWRYTPQTISNVNEYVSTSPKIKLVKISLWIQIISASIGHHTKHAASDPDV